MGDPTSCKTRATWEYYAASICKDNGTVISQIDGGETCKLEREYGYRGVKFQCCPHEDQDMGDGCGDEASDETTSIPKPKPADIDDDLVTKPLEKPEYCFTESFGGVGWQVDTLEQFDHAFATAQESDRLHVIDVRVDADVYASHIKPIRGI